VGGLVDFLFPSRSWRLGGEKWNALDMFRARAIVLVRIVRPQTTLIERRAAADNRGTGTETGNVGGIEIRLKWTGQVGEEQNLRPRNHENPSQPRRSDMAHISLPDGVPGIRGLMAAYPETQVHLSGGAS
jgi:hypothetical protein